jgi:menaquinone-9 beta-reductase
MPDVLIAGGGIAGCALAILLGREGVAVELFERAQFPREKACGEGLMPAGVTALARLGIEGAGGGAPFRGVRYRSGKLCIAGDFPGTPGISPMGRGQRRRVLDELLFREAASTPGVRARTNACVESVILENGRATGLIVDGKRRAATMVVAADGVHSRLREQLGLGLRTRRKRVGLCAHFHLARNVELPEWVEVVLGRGHEVYVTPLPRREVLAAVLVDAAALDDAPEAFFRKCLAAEPYLMRLLEGSEHASALLAISPLAGRARRGYAPGIVLLGDAAGFVDPITGGGMTQALTSAELLAGFIALGDCSDECLGRFDRARCAMLRDSEILAAAASWLASQTWAARAALEGLRVFPGIFSHLAGVAGGVRRLWPPASSGSFRDARPKPGKAPMRPPQAAGSLGSSAPLAIEAIGER